jgi:hypothetical protein
MMALGLNLARRPIVGGASFSASIGSGDVVTGTELTATVNGLQGGEVVTYQWTDDGADISGATSSTYTVAIGTGSVADASQIRCVATVDGTPYTSAARRVVYAAGSFGALSNQSFEEDNGDETYVFDAATGTGLTWTYSLVSPPSGVTINSGTRTITFDTDALAVQSGTAIGVAAVDQYGRAATGSPRSFDLTITEADTTAPTISDVSVSDITATGAGWSVTTNEAGGTVYVRVRPSGDAAWNATQIQAAPSDTATPAVSG